MEILNCDICEACFKSEMGLTGHKISVHGLREDSHPCKLCPASFSEYSILASHITSVHLKPKPYSCSKCSESFLTIQGMIEHLAVHEEQNQSEEKVHEEVKHLPNFDGKRNDDLKFKVESVHDKKKPFKCSVCDSRFAKKRQFNGHMSTHNFDRKFKCEICGYRFKQVHHLKDHNATVHLEGEKPFKCHLCETDFTLKNSFVLHLKRFHGGKINQNKDQISTVHEAKKSSSQIEKKQDIKEKNCRKAPARIKLDSNSGCGEIFQSAFMMKAHNNLKHAGVKFECTSCKMEFKVKNFIEPAMFCFSLGFLARSQNVLPWVACL